MDTTYFGRKWGVMVFKDSLSGQILYKQYVKQETNKLYLSGIEEIARRGIKIQAIICDGRKGLFQQFIGIPIQMCVFHQVAIIRRYLTKKPKMQASKELWEHALLLSKTDKESFEGGLDDWYKKWSGFLNKKKSVLMARTVMYTKSLEVLIEALKQTCPGCLRGMIIWN